MLTSGFLLSTSFAYFTLNVSMIITMVLMVFGLRLKLSTTM